MKSPAFQWYPADYLGSQRVQLMTLEEEGGYIRLLCFCWLHGSIPSDISLIAKLIGKGASTTLATTLAQMFKPDGKDRLVHDRLDAERRKQHQWRIKSSEGGVKSQNLQKKRSHNHSGNQHPPEGSLSNGCKGGSTLHLQSSSSSSDIGMASPSIHQAELDETRGDLHISPPSTDSLVDSIYAAYPRRVGRIAAVKAIDRALKSQPAIRGTLLASVQRFAAAVAQWPPGDRQYVPHPATWFNRGSYDDDPKTWERTPANGVAVPWQRDSHNSDHEKGF